jgi:hypothetical protein
VDGELALCRDFTCMYINGSSGIWIKNLRVEPVEEDGTALDPTVTVISILLEC